MSRATKKDREQFVARLAQEYPAMPPGDVADLAGRIMRHGATYARLQEAMCNGDFPADNGERRTKVCPKCGNGWAPASYVGDECPDCHRERLIAGICAQFPKRWRVLHDDKLQHVADSEGDAMAWLLSHQSASIHHATTHEGWKIEAAGVSPIFNGDPRGATVKLSVPSGKTDDWGQVGICVPTA